MSTLPVPASPSNFLAWATAQSAIRDVRDLVQGNAPFDQMPVEERAQALQDILGAIEGCEPLLFPAMKKLDDRALLIITADESTTEPMRFEATAELCRRLSAPTPAERDEIEMRIVAEEQDQPDPYEAA